MLLLHIDSSVLGGQSASRSLTAQIVAAEVARHPGIKVVHRDLAASPFDHLTGEHVAALRGGAAPSTPRVVDDLAAGLGALEEFLAADVIVIGAPMYNFGIPSQLKSWTIASRWRARRSSMGRAAWSASRAGSA